MKYTDFVKEISAQSKETERPLAQDDVKVCFDLAREVIINLLNAGDQLVIRDFLKFETKTQKEKHIKHIKTGEMITVPECVVPRVVLSENFKKEVKSSVK